MSREIKLPAPWLHIRFISNPERDHLENLLGVGLTSADLDESDTLNGEPITRKAFLLSAFVWAEIQNSANGSKAFLRLQDFGNGDKIVNGISLPSNPNGDEISGTNLRSIPVAALGEAYSYDSQLGEATWRRTVQLFAEIAASYDPLTPLPPADSGEKFAALVGYQYQALEKRNPEGYIPSEMAELNDKPLPTIQRWIANARKLGYLPRTRSGRKPNA